jgi:hypothetical protein
VIGLQHQSDGGERNRERNVKPHQSSASSAPSHVELLAVAGGLRRAALIEDLDAIHRELSRLRSDLVHHLRAERDALAGLPGAIPVVVCDGQERLLRLLDELLFALSDDPAECACLVRSAEIEVALRRQAKLESALLGRLHQR